MWVHPPSRTQPIRRGSSTLLRHDMRARPREDRVVRILVGRKLYAYQCVGQPRLGSLVRAVTPFSGTVKRRVLAFGRGRYTGPLKRCTLVHR